MGSFKVNKRIFVIITLLTLLLTGITAVANSYSYAEASGACKEVGSFMGRNSIGSKEDGVPGPESSDRKWTVSELFGNSVAYSSFYGEGPGTWFFAEKVDRGSHHSGWSGDIQSKLEDSREAICFLGGMDWTIQPFIALSNVLTSLTGSTIKNLVGKDLMAETLTKIVGGESAGDGGLIGTFLSSFYMPLIVLTVLIMVVTIVYKGLIQMKFREALNSMIWTLGAFVIGVTLMLNPQLLAGAPQAVTSTITTCVLGALSGQNCLSGSVQTPSLLAGKECLSTVNDPDVSDSETVVNSLNCTIWKAFVLDPWAEQQFGAPYSKLYTESPPSGGEIWENLPEGDGSKYCVSLTSSGSYADAIRSGTAVMDGDGVCNVALYHLFIKTDMKDTYYQSGNNYDDSGVMITDDTGKYDSRWYDIIIPMAGDESKWRHWSGDGMYWSKLITSVISLIAIIAASTVLLTLALFGGAYKIIGLILMAFAPIFLLFAIEPTRGRRIFLGWLETLVSSFLKYFAITVLIVIALIMYAGLLSNTSGFTSLIGILVMTVALHMYRKEIVDLIGASNMGGQRLSNKVNEVGSKLGKVAKEKGAAVAGGAIGGAMGRNKARNERVKARKDTIKDLQDKLSEATTDEEKEFYQEEIDKEQKLLDSDTAGKAIVGGAFSGSGDSFKRSMKRGTGLAANVLQQSDRTKEALKRTDAENQNTAQSARAKFEEDLERRRSDEQQSEETIVAPQTAAEKEYQVAINAVRDTQRENVEYEGDLSDGEKQALNDFADKLASSASDEDLIGMANDEAVMNDPNKKNLVANEINARIKANSMVGLGSQALGRTGLGNEHLSREELKLNIEMQAENYLETGDERELEKYLSSMEEYHARIDRPFDSEAIGAKMEEYRERAVKNGGYERRENIPREEDLVGKDNYQVTLSDGTQVDTKNVETPESLQKEAKRPEVAEAKKALVNVAKEREEIQQQELERQERERQQQEQVANPLPNINELENKPQQQQEQQQPSQRQEQPEQQQPQQRQEQQQPQQRQQQPEQRQESQGEEKSEISQRQIDKINEDLYRQVVNFANETKNATISQIQREFNVGYVEAKKIIDTMAERGEIKEDFTTSRVYDEETKEMYDPKDKNKDKSLEEEIQDNMIGLDDFLDELNNFDDDDKK